MLTVFSMLLPEMATLRLFSLAMSMIFWTLWTLLEKVAMITRLSVLLTMLARELPTLCSDFV